LLAERSDDNLRGAADMDCKAATDDPRGIRLSSRQPVDVSAVCLQGRSVFRARTCSDFLAGGSWVRLTYFRHCPSVEAPPAGAPHDAWTTFASRRFFTEFAQQLLQQLSLFRPRHARQQLL